MRNKQEAFAVQRSESTKEALMASTDAGSLNLPGAERESDRPLRIALISTPRCGNNWLRHLLAGLYRLPSLPVHTTCDLDWANLPRECVLAIHWHPTASFLERLSEHGFQNVVLARHPLDVLISILHFALHYSSSQATQRWLEGEEGNERCIFAAMPRSTAFLDYATSRRAAALLSVSHEWWHLPGCAQVRYEDLLKDTEGTLQRLTEALGAPGRAPFSEVVAGTSMPRLRQSTGAKYHFWQGQSGLWRDLLSTREATLIASAHLPILADLGYVVEPDPTLDGAQADANWINLIWEELAESLFALRQQGRSESAAVQLQAQLAQHAELAARFTATQNQLVATQVTYREMLEKLTSAEQTVGELRARGTLAENNVEELRLEQASLRLEQATLQGRLAAADETCEELREQLLQMREWHGTPPAGGASRNPTLALEEGTPRTGRLALTMRRLGQRYPPLASLARWVKLTDET